MTPFDAKARAEKISDFVYSQIDRDGEWIDWNKAIEFIAAALSKTRAEALEEVLAILPKWSEDAVSCGEFNSKRHKPVCHYETVVALDKRIRALAAKGESDV